MTTSGTHGTPHFVEIAAQGPWETLPSFFSKRRQDVNQLRAALYDGDLPSVQRVGHLMKEKGEAYGLREIPHFGAALESAARTGDFAAAYTLTTQLESYLCQVHTMTASPVG